MRRFSDKEKALLREKIQQAQTERRQRIGQEHGWRKLCPKCTRLGLRPTGAEEGATLAESLLSRSGRRRPVRREYRCSNCGHVVWFVDRR